VIRPALNRKWTCQRFRLSASRGDRNGHDRLRIAAYYRPYTYTHSAEAELH
jgi:hypothetical protein